MQISTSRILVVDDEPNVLMTVQAILSEEGYEVHSCADGASAIQSIRQHHFDLVLTDLKMPGVDGLAVLAEVRKDFPNTVTVMMTGYGSVDSAIEAIQLGAYEYLLKPVEVPELKAAVRRALERKRFSEIDALYNVSRTLTSSLDRSAISAEVCSAVTRVLTLANVRLLLFERDESSIDCGNEDLSQAARDLHAAICQPALWSRLEAGETIVANDAAESRQEWAHAAGIKSFVMLPGIAAGRLVCVLCADNGPSFYDFHASALRFLQALASQTAMALENASLVAELKKSNVQMADANKKLRDLDKLKSQFLAVATHELRTPLSVILGYNSMLAESLDDRLNADERDTLRESMSACRRLIGLVNSMLDISQIESGKMRMQFADADLRDIIRGVISLLHYEAERKKVTLRALVPDDLPHTHVDGERIQQVLINLVANSLKFTDAGGSVSVIARVRPESQILELSVTDTGIGIEPQYHSTIFDEFAQIKAHGPARRRSGSGLGLAIVKRIVEAHRGSIHLHSTVGQGSTFTITLPLTLRRPAVKTAMSA